MFNRILNSTLPNNFLQLKEGLRRSFPQGNFGLLLPHNSLDLHQTQKQNEILDSPIFLISLEQKYKGIIY